jgi:hypothetical protein
MPFVIVFVFVTLNLAEAGYEEEKKVEAATETSRRRISRRRFCVTSTV